MRGEAVHAALCRCAEPSPPTPHKRARPTPPPVRSLGYLVNKNRTEQLQEVVAALCSKLLTSNKEQLRDVASLGLKTVVAGEARGSRAGPRVGGGLCAEGCEQAPC